MSVTDQVIGTPRREPQRWLELHGDALWRYAITHARHAEVAEELLQETFLGALESIANFRGDSSERTWLISILRRKIADHFRRSGRARGQGAVPAASGSLEDMYGQDGMWRIDPGKLPDQPDRVLADPQFRRDYEACLSRIPVGLSEAFEMREVHGMDPEVICGVLEISVGNLWVRLYRARTMLRACLWRKWSPRD